MKTINAKLQTVSLTAIHAIVRGIGFLLRIFLSRSFGAEILGIYELAQSIHFTAAVPLTAGLPAAVSRMTAKADAAGKHDPLRSGLHLVRLISLILIPCFLLLSPLAARVSGDWRILPSLWLSSPCILILGYSAVYNGYCYGIGRSFLPVMSELTEQLVRVVVIFISVCFLQHLTAPYLAAVPFAAAILAELVGLWFVLSRLALPLASAYHPESTRKLWTLAYPATASRFFQTGIKSLTSVFIPLRLQLCGLSQSEALTRFGFFQGMIIPVLLLPCIFTNALSMLLLPKIARFDKSRAKLSNLLSSCFFSVCSVGLLSALAVFISAPFLANRIFRQAELTELFRFSAPWVVPIGLSHVLTAFLSGLGKQKSSMYGAFAISTVVLLLSWVLPSVERLQLKGIILAYGIGEILTVFWCCIVIAGHLHSLSVRPVDGKCV